ncbi:hypothetical protein VHEMI08411 [[Torrubiella] hemipterigena]|uniref:Uncharacterized protein n=1 Tax=[Torrubiella] hemipterigena TaxID=1531966 RepID=A0A0A1T6P5_9HYPO|nr:hypothetical protein VHEMI08411 [[Torrubiella] hemipterigena]
MLNEMLVMTSQGYCCFLTRHSNIRPSISVLNPSVFPINFIFRFIKQTLFNMGLFSSSSTPKRQAPAPVQSFTITQHSMMGRQSLIHDTRSPPGAPPILSVQLHQMSRPNIELYLGAGAISNPPDGSPPRTCATIDIATFGSSGRGQVRGKAIEISRASMFGGEYAVTAAGVGSLTWEPTGWGSHSWQLCDSTDTVVASARCEGFTMREMVLDMYAPGDEFYTDVLLISLLTVMRLAEKRRRKRRTAAM